MMWTKTQTRLVEAYWNKLSPREIGNKVCPRLSAERVCKLAAEMGLPLYQPKVGRPRKNWKLSPVVLNARFLENGWVELAPGHITDPESYALIERAVG